MSYLLIGSSNVNRHYKSPDFKNVRSYKMVKCTQVTGFNAYMQNLDKECKSVVISVFENFVADAVGADVMEPEETIDNCVKDFLSTVSASAVRLPDTKFAIVLPLRRPALKWYQEHVEPITKFITKGIRAMISDKVVNNVAAIPSHSAHSGILSAV
jgi:hypothetical protein